MTVEAELLQKVASGQEVLLVEIKRLRDSHGELSEEFQIHRRDDREDFNRVFAVMESNRKDRSEQFGRVIDALVKRMDKQDDNLRDLSRMVAESDKRDLRTTDRAAGATSVIRWIVVGTLGLIGSALLVVLGWLLNHYFR